MKYWNALSTKKSHLHVLWIYDFIFSFVFAILNWNVLTFIIYSILYDIVLYLVTKRDFILGNRVSGFVFKFLGWTLGRLAVGDNDPFRRLRDINDDDSYDYPKYSSILHEVLPMTFFEKSLEKLYSH